jgi:hypothetical protein
MMIWTRRLARSRHPLGPERLEGGTPAFGAPRPTGAVAPFAIRLPNHNL